MSWIRQLSGMTSVLLQLVIRPWSERWSMDSYSVILRLEFTFFWNDFWLIVKKIICKEVYFIEMKHISYEVWYLALGKYSWLHISVSFPLEDSCPHDILVDFHSCSFSLSRYLWLHLSSSYSAIHLLYIYCMGIFWGNPIFNWLWKNTFISP